MSVVKPVDYSEQLSRHRELHRKAVDDLKNSNKVERERLKLAEEIKEKKLLKNLHDEKLKIEEKHTEGLVTNKEQSEKIYKEARDKYFSSLKDRSDEFRKDRVEQKQDFEKNIDRISNAFDRYKEDQNFTQKSAQGKEKNRYNERVEQLAENFHKKNAETEDIANKLIKQTKEEFLTKKKEISDENTKKINELRVNETNKRLEDIDQKKREMVRAQVGFAEDLKNLDTRHNKVLEITKQRNMENIGGINEKYIAAMEKQDDEHMLDRREVVKNKKDVIDTINNSHFKEMGRIRDQQLKELKGNQKSLEEIPNTHQKEGMEKRFKAHKSEMNDLHRYQQKQEEKVGNEYNDSLRKVKEDFSDRLADSQKFGSRQLKTVLNRTGAEKELMLSNFREKEKDSAEIFADKISHKDLNAKITRKNDHEFFNKKMTGQEDNSQEDRVNLIKSFKAKEKEVERLNTKTRKDTNIKNSNVRENDMRKFVENMDFKDNERSGSLELMRKDFSQKNRDIVRRFEDERSDLIDNLRNGFTDKMMDQEKAHEERIREKDEKNINFQAEAARKMNEAQDRLAKDNRYKDYLLQEKQNEYREALHTVQTRLETRHNRDFMNAKKSFDERLSAAQHKFNEKLIAVTRDLEGRLEAQESEHQRDSLQKNRAGIQEKLQQIKNHEMEKANIEAKYESQLATLRQDYDHYIKKLKRGDI